MTFDLPKQAATPKFGIQVVLLTEPKPVTVCKTEPSCKKAQRNMSIKMLKSDFWIIFLENMLKFSWFGNIDCQIGVRSGRTCKDQMLSSPPIPPETRAIPVEQNERDFTAVMWPWSTNTHFALSCCKKEITEIMISGFKWKDSYRKVKLWWHFIDPLFIIVKPRLQKDPNWPWHHCFYVGWGSCSVCWAKIHSYPPVAVSRRTQNHSDNLYKR